MLIGSQLVVLFLWLAGLFAVFFRLFRPTPAVAGEVGAGENKDDRPDPETNPDSPVMFVGDWVPEDPSRIAFSKLPPIPAEHAVISDVRDAGGTRVNQHNYLVYYRGRYWAMWSDGPGLPRTDDPEKHRELVPGHDRIGQRISYATSEDGLNWGPVRDLSGPPQEGCGYLARGFWEREGQLLALVTGYRGHGRSGGFDLEAFRWSDSAEKWEYAGMVRKNSMNNFPPKRLPGGEWMMTRRRSGDDQVHVLVGGTEAFNSWESFAIPAPGGGQASSEPYWWLLPDGKYLVGLFRDNTGSHRIWRAFSGDFGRTWSCPVKTNFPDSQSKFHSTRLSDGRYVLVIIPVRKDPAIL